MKKQKSELFTAREVQTALNNAVVITAKPATGALNDSELRKQREYFQALVEVCWTHIEEGLLTPEQLVHGLACSTYFAYIRYVGGGEKLPASKQAKELLEK